MDDPRQLRRAFLSQLRELGYGCTFRRAGWCEVLVWRGEERWLGEGPDRRSALAAVLARMFPSAAARASLVARAQAAPVREAVEPEVAAAPARAADPKPVPAASEEPTGAPREVLWQPPPPPQRISGAQLQNLHDELHELSATLDELFVDVLEWAPRRMRLVLLAWVARARDVQERARYESSVEQRVTGICTRLSLIAKLGWPGNVPALAREARPEECAESLGLLDSEAPRDWAEVAERAEERIAALEARPDLDELGWADEACLAPAPPDPRSLLREVQRALEAWSGPLPDVQAIAEGARFGGEPALSLAQALPTEARGELLALARKLRWLRGCELRGWAEAFGRLRWIVSRARLAGLAELDSALDEGFRPRQPWARECGYDPEARARKNRRNELYRRLEALPRGDSAALLQWLGAAFELGQELHNGKLAQVLADRAGEVLALPLEAYEDRGKRKRLRKLQELLQNGAVAGSVEEEPEAEEPRPERTPDAEDGNIPAGVLRFTRGKRTLIVGNRTDPALDAALERAFELGKLDRCDLSPNRVESHAERIRAGSYELVLATTGFMPHKTDHAFRKACLAAGVRFVRVNKGRPSACARHLARELGLQPDTTPLLR